MADAEARREARRQKILQNSDARMKKLLGTKIIDGDEQGEIKEATPSETATISPNTSPVVNNRDQTQNAETLGTDEHVDDKKTRTNTVKIARLDRTEENTGMRERNSHIGGARLRTTGLQPVVESERGPKSEQVTSGHSSTQTLVAVKQFDFLRVGCCVLLAVISRGFLSFGFGIFYIQSIFIPFLAMEIALFAYQFNTMRDIVLPQKRSFMVGVLMLCGIRADLLAVYNRIMGYITAFTQDFAMFLFTFLITNMFMSLPDSSIEAA